MALPSPSDLPYIVAIGASAGGLESMLSLFSSLEKNGHFTFIVAQHLAHDAHTDLIVRLLNRESKLPILLAEHNQTLRADTIYLIPAGCNGYFDANRLLLQPPAENSLSTPSVNVLFDSLALTAKHRGIGIVLSGTGRDGASGCLSIKAAGGIIFAQQPESTKFNGMPNSAIEKKAVDYILSVDMIAETLNTLFSQPEPYFAAATPAPLAENALSSLLTQIFEATGIDFSGYKEETLQRRLNKRLDVLALDSIEQYLDYIAAHPDELHAIQHLFLVSLSSFFRDCDSFTELNKALAETLSRKPAGSAIRFWAPGCASGEEAYTLAIIVSQLLGACLNERSFSIIGTDLNDEAIESAKRGSYRQTAFQEMPADLLERYFVEKGHHYEVIDNLRGICRFERQNVTGQAPEQDLDLISCRNLLIYLKSPLQNQIIRNFYDALRPHGLLFVGQAESIGITGNTLFYPVNHYHKIYRRRP